MSRTKLKTGVSTGPVIYPAKPRHDFFEQSLKQRHELGARYTTEDGRAFRYAKNGGTALVTGNLIQSALYGGSSATVQTDIAVQADSAIGDTSLYVTLATDAAAKDVFAGGYLCIGDDAGEGQLFRIIGNSVATGGGTCRIDLDRPILIAALITTSLVQLMTDPYKLVIKSDSTASGLILGVAQLAVDVNYYCWLQTWGMACVKVKTAGLMGTAAVYDPAAAGSVGAQTAGASSILGPEVGSFPNVVATTQSGLVFLTIAP